MVPDRTRDPAQAGVLTGNNVRKLFDYAKEHKVRRLEVQQYVSTQISSRSLRSQ
jgi:hypothetical protein